MRQAGEEDEARADDEDNEPASQPAGHLHDTPWAESSRQATASLFSSKMAVARILLGRTTAAGWARLLPLQTCVAATPKLLTSPVGPATARRTLADAVAGGRRAEQLRRLVPLRAPSVLPQLGRQGVGRAGLLGATVPVRGMAAVKLGGYNITLKRIGYIVIGTLKLLKRRDGAATTGVTHCPTLLACIELFL